VKIHVSDPTLVDDLVDALQEKSCEAVRTDARTVEVRDGWATDPDGGQYELDGFLRVWEALHPGVAAMRMG
jgi:hypothetical protein